MEELERVKKFLELAPESEVDEYALNNLKNRLYRWKNAEIEYLADIEYYINGKRYDRLLDAFYEVENLKKVKIKFLKPNIDGPWNFSKPTKEIKEKDGKGICKTFDYDPTSFDSWITADYCELDKVMIRAFISDFFVPISIQTKSQYHRAEEVPRQYDPHLKKLRELWSDIRDGVVPFGIRLSLYTKNERYPLVIDPIKDKVKPHPLSSVNKLESAEREPIDYMNFDKILAWMDFPDLVKKIFEFLFETGKTPVYDIAGRLNIDQSVTKNNLKTLEKEKLVEKKKDVHYKVNTEMLAKKAKELPGG